MLRVQLSGYLGSDAEVRNHEGKVFFNFSVANNFRVKKEDEWQERTQWEQCSIVLDNDKLNNIEYLKSTLLKGAFVYIDKMRYHIRAYIGKDGEEKASLRWFVKNSDITIVQSCIKVEVPPEETADIPEDLPF